MVIDSLKMGKTPHPTPHTPHPATRKNFLPQTLTNRNQKFEFLLEKKLAFPCQARVSESRFGQGFPKVPE
ncbi:hypothetical protein N0824_00550 [Microcystis sp. 0824]|nr:hypothetical protein N0824_00550 [Microcystis sp. 0824]